jgi:hypothetical protein
MDFSASASEPQPQPLLVMSKVLRRRADQGVVGPVAMPTPLLGVGSEKMTGMLPTGQSVASKVYPRGKKYEPEGYVPERRIRRLVTISCLGLARRSPFNISLNIMQWLLIRAQLIVEVQQYLTGGREITNTLESLQPADLVPFPNNLYRKGRLIDLALLRLGHGVHIQQWLQCCQACVY